MTAGTNSQEATKTNMAVRIGIGVALSVLSGVMLLLAFPPYGVWPLAWVAFVPYLFAQHRLLPRKWSSLSPAIALLLWLGPFMARLFSTESGPVFTYLYFQGSPCRLPRALTRSMTRRWAVWRP